MLIEKYLQESSSTLIENVDPMFSSFITGEDPNELCVMTSEANETFRGIDENVLYAESLAYVSKLQGNVAAAEKLQESVVKDVFAKIIDGLKKLYAQVKAFFINLFKSIAVQVVSVEKSLKDIDKYIQNKDFSKFEYDGYDWKDTDIASNISSAVVKAIGEKARFADSILADARTQVANNDPSNVPTLNKPNELSAVAAIATNSSLGSKVTTIEQAKIAINEAYGITGTKKKFTGKPNLNGMVEFLKGFNNNKALKTLQKSSNDSYSEAIKTVDKMRKEAATINTDEKTKKVAGSAISNLKATASSLNAILGAYNNMMNACIANEKARFSEYRGIIAKAVRVKGKTNQE